MDRHLVEDTGFAATRQLELTRSRRATQPDWQTILAPVPGERAARPDRLCGYGI